MAATMVNKMNGSKVEVPQGFSWTTLFFGFFVPLFRGDILGAILMFAAAWISFGISLIVFPFIYNKMYENSLLKKGYSYETKTHYDL